MNRIISWMATNHVAANLGMLLIIFVGGISLFSLKQEIFPELPLNMISINTVYRGATPDDIENSIVLKIEEAISSVEGIEEINSLASEGVGNVTAVVETGYNVSKVKDDIKSEIDRIRSFPEDAEDPIIKINVKRSLVIQVAIFGDTDEKSLTSYTEKVRDDLLEFDNITQVEISGAKGYQLRIEVSEEKLNEYGLTFDMISGAIQSSSLDLPSGSIDTKDGEILLRSGSKARLKRDFESIIIRSDIFGRTIFLKDIADIVDGFDDSDLISFFNNKNSQMITVYQVGKQRATDIAETVKKYIEDNKGNHPYGISVDYWQDNSKLLKDRINLLVKNGILGFILVLISLTLFLDIRVAFWVSIGILISFFGSFIVVSQFGESINMISLFAFIVVLGIVVDDAIVVGESIFLISKKEGSKKGSILGTQRVSTPVIFATLTTVATFLPLAFVDGTMGRVFKVIPIVVISVLVFSLIESLLILPSHLSGINHQNRGRFITFFGKISSFFDKKLQAFISDLYLPFLKKSLNNRYLTIAISISLLLFSLGLIRGDFLKFSYFPDIEGDNIVVNLKMPVGTPFKTTESIVKYIEKKAFEVAEDFKERSLNNRVIKNISTVIGDEPFKKMRREDNGITITDPTIGEINIELYPPEERGFSAYDLMESWRSGVGEVAGIKSIKFESSLMSPGNDIEYKLAHQNYDTVKEIVEKFKEKISTFDGTGDIEDSFKEGKFELSIKLKKVGRSLGISEFELAKQIREGFFGREVQKIQRGKNEVKVLVQYGKDGRSSLSDLENMDIKTRDGRKISIGEVADLKYKRGYSRITRFDKKRVIGVTASVDKAVASSNKINEELKEYLEDLKEEYRGFEYFTGGAQKQQMKSMKTLAKGAVIGLFVVYMLLAIPFKSYSKPIIIMSAIPFGVLGAIFGHLLMGYNFSIISLLGIVALAGVVVNDSLVFVDFMNKKIDSGVSVHKAAMETGFIRFRPILLTSITTFLGLFPMILETSLQARFIVPMAISLGFGIIFATAITLIFVPAGILILDDIHNLFKREEVKNV
ncbi:MAG: acriflavin resistance protein [Candidatus Cloacimonadota bacterium]|nr:MAG: acriflavin resistance protein [Candidatus Cloacimonadota bacterium]PIE77922.1 MAG: acriflavin resistance protein [Candidatus Delongbacteria bacterium]